MDKTLLIKRKAELEEELQNLPYISTVDEDGETNDDAYQEKLEQGWYKDELRNELREVNEKLAKLTLGRFIYSQY